MAIVEIFDGCGNVVTAIPESAHTNSNVMAYFDFNPKKRCTSSGHIYLRKLITSKWQHRGCLQPFQSEDGISGYKDYHLQDKYVLETETTVRYQASSHC